MERCSGKQRFQRFRGRVPELETQHFATTTMKPGSRKPLIRESFFDKEQDICLV